MIQIPNTYTVTVEGFPQEKWNVIAREVAFFVDDDGEKIALRNPFGDDTVLDSDIHSIIGVEAELVNNGVPWFRPDGTENPPTPRNVMSKDEAFTAEPFK